MHRIDFEDLFKRLPSPHMVLDRELRFVAVNPAYEATTGRSSAELVGRPLFEMFPDPGRSGRMLRASLERVFETGESDTLALIPYAIAGSGPDQPMETRYWTAVHTPLRSREGETLYIMQNTVDVTEIVRNRKPGKGEEKATGPEVQLIERAQEAERAQRTAIAESSEFRRLFRQAPQMMAVLSGPDHVFTFTNDAYSRFVGGRNFVGQPIRSALPEIEGQGFFEMLDAVYTTGVEQTGEGVRMMLDQGKGDLEEAFIDFSFRAVHDAEGKVDGVFLQAMDRTETFRHLRHQRLLLDELNHRVNNTLATVQSIASQTLRSADDLPSARRDLERRIIALSRAHNLLSARSWKGIELRSLAEGQVAPYADQSRITFAGPDLMISPQTAIALAMLFHELADNAARHGSLSSDKGVIALGWHRATKDEGIVLEWRESGGPAVVPPSHRGFGMRIMERVARSELGGGLMMEFLDDGFRCRIELPELTQTRTENA